MSLEQALKNAYNLDHLPKRYEGYICTFDLDKTYLSTEFETLTGLIKIPFESAREKINIPGSAALVRELRRGSGGRYRTPVFFISGSPRRFEKTIREKFALDGVEIDGILFKDFWRAIRKLKFKKIIDKIGYKLAALLYGRAMFPPKANELLFGDDSEYDATIYSLYADIVAGDLDDFEVLTILKKWDVADDERNLIHENMQLLKQTQWKPREAVEKIFIHLEMKTAPHDHMVLSEKVIPTMNYLQTAIILENSGLITRAGFYRILSDLIRNHNFTVEMTARSIEDLLHRGLINRKNARKLLKTVIKGNPLALPRRIMLEVRRDLSQVLETVSRMPSNMLAARHDELTLVEQYLRYVPTRRV